MMSKHNLFLRIARELSTESKDPSTKVGAVLVDSDNKILGLGYNGFPSGFPDDHEFLNNRAIKYELVIHAEANAILNASGRNLKGSTVYCTHKPCSRCMAMLAQVGVVRSVYIPPSGEMASRFDFSYRLTDAICAHKGIEQLEFNFDGS